LLGFVQPDANSATAIQQAAAGVGKSLTFIFERRAYADARSAQIKIAEACDCNHLCAPERSDW